MRYYEKEEALGFYKPLNSMDMCVFIVFVGPDGYFRFAMIRYAYMQ